MKYILFALVFFVSYSICAMPIDSITADTSRMSSDVLKKHFDLKEGEEFSEQKYDQAKQDLEKLGVFRTLEFVYKEKKDGVDIHIKADDRTYIIPMLFGLSGNKHSFGASVEARNLFKQAESASLFVGGGRDGFDTHGSLILDKHSFYMGYEHINFDQRFYNNGWTSNKNIFSSADDKNKYTESLQGEVHGRQDDFYVTYLYQISNLWNVSITPQYEYYEYQNHMLDSGKHSHLSVGIGYTDGVSAGMNMDRLTGVEYKYKADILQDFTRLKTGKLAEIFYTTGGKWTGSDYDISKISLSGVYLLEFKMRHALAFFAKAERAFTAPFSNEVESSDLLFGLGIYDREQRGKNGVSGGISFSYYLMRNEKGLLSVTPFYEQAYISSGGHAYQPHSGIGATMAYRWWRIPLPISLNFTHNLNDGNQHVGCKVGGKF